MKTVSKLNNLQVINKITLISLYSNYALRVTEKNNSIYSSYEIHAEDGGNV